MLNLNELKIVYLSFVGKSVFIIGGVLGIGEVMVMWFCE